MDCVACGTAFNLALLISFPESLHIPYVPFLILIKAFCKLLIKVCCLAAN